MSIYLEKKIKTSYKELNEDKLLFAFLISSKEYSEQKCDKINSLELIILIFIEFSNTSTTIFKFFSFISFVWLLIFDFLNIIW